MFFKGGMWLSLTVFSILLHAVPVLGDDAAKQEINTLLDRAKNITSVYYESILEFNGKKQEFSKVWERPPYSKSQGDGNDSGKGSCPF